MSASTPLRRALRWAITKGKFGQRFLDRIADAGLIASNEGGHADDAAFAAGVGFTDIVKRPTRSARDLSKAELDHGRDELRAKLNEIQPGIVIFTFKATAQTLLGRFRGNGFVPRLQNKLGSPVFVMPGPTEKKAKADATLDQLRKFVERT